MGKFAILRSALVVGQAWCEAVVQRVADFVDPADAPGSATLHAG